MKRLLYIITLYYINDRMKHSFTFQLNLIIYIYYNLLIYISQLYYWGDTI